jgi:hypothetical protein
MTKACGCPDTYPDWHNQDLDLGGQCVHRLSIPTLMHMPLAYEMYARRQQQDIERLQLQERWPGFTLTRTGLFRGAIMRLLESSDSPARHIEFLPSPYHLRGYLHHGSVGNIQIPVRQVSLDLLEQGRRPKELYLCYLTCPQCRGEDDKDRILLLRRWVASRTFQQRGKG